jgi:hypothetical protein
LLKYLSPKEKGRNMLTSRLRQKDFAQALPEFYCPNCQTHRSYLVKPIADVNIVCLIPLFHSKDNTQVVECQVCKNGFDPEILSLSNRSLFKLVAATRTQLLSGTTPGSLKVRLMSDGLNEDFVDKIIGLALN